MDKSLLKSVIPQLSPSYFALVMATGIVAMASHLQQYTVISNLLFWVNNIAFLILLLLFVLRLVFFFPNVVADLHSHTKGAGFLTMVAGACILGTTYAQTKNAFGPATLLWYFGMITWTLFIFSFLSSVILATEKPSPEKGLNGIWFLLVVSTQSLSILIGTLTPHLLLPANVAIFFSLFDFLLGAMLYLMLAPVVIYRLLFYPMKPEEVSPSYWINMGAAAITTLAGVMLLQNIKTNAVLEELYPFVYGSAVLFWCVASFWIPLVFIMEIWRYLIKRSPLHYTPGFWSMVFPLGTYCVCSWRLAEVMHLQFLSSLSKVFLYAA
ncbi:MAG TPA: tellurite resistance/C4-dicarboxylate transporter family protein [Flavisolibacter sp.]|nr:tellurite resistance/C4-dicarboxylate transporter family protein [Flavisolibacter sp.]